MLPFLEKTPFPAYPLHAFHIQLNSIYFKFTPNSLAATQLDQKQALGVDSSCGLGSFSEECVYKQNVAFKIVSLIVDLAYLVVGWSERVRVSCS